MSAKIEKALRRARRQHLGISKAAEREEAEFAALVARRRVELTADNEIRSLAPKRRALAWATLALFLAFIVAPILLGGC